MNLLFLISCLLTILIFSLDDIKKLNPISSKSEIPGAQIRVVNLHNSKIWIPWRMAYEHINYKLCNETSMINNSDFYIIDIDLDKLYCIDMEDLDIGGSFDSDFLNLITFDLYICKNGIEYDENNTN